MKRNCKSMARHPKLEKITEILRNGQDFQINRAQYIEYTGVDIPQDRYYTERKSSVAKRAKEYGYEIHVIPETLVFTKKSE